MISDQAVAMLAGATKQMVDKFTDAEAKHGWKDYWRTTPEAEWRTGLEDHIRKGDPRDVMIYCAIALARGWATSVEPPSDTVVGQQLHALLRQAELLDEERVHDVTAGVLRGAAKVLADVWREASRRRAFELKLIDRADRAEREVRRLSGKS